jgi:hypothetical protein
MNDIFIKEGSKKLIQHVSSLILIIVLGKTLSCQEAILYEGYFRSLLSSVDLKVGEEVHEIISDNEHAMLEI